MTDGGGTSGQHGDERILASLQALHDRLDALERRAALQHPQARAAQLPGWRRESPGEVRWQVAACTAIAIALQLPAASRLALRPSWALPAAEGLLLVALIAVNPSRIDRESRAVRWLSLSLAALISLANAWSVTLLTIDLVNGTGPGSAARLLAIGGSVWLTNMLVFALWYWEFDQGGPAARALATGSRPPDFMFPQMSMPENPHLTPPDWKPSFLDYFYLSFTNATAFSPTDTMPMSRLAKMAMTLQSVVSLLTATLVIARAVNILG